MFYLPVAVCSFPTVDLPNYISMYYEIYEMKVEHLVGFKD